MCGWLQRSMRAALLVLLVIAICVTTVFGIATSFAASSTPSPAGKVTLRVGWTAEPDNINPFIGTLVPAWEIFGLNYDYLVGFDGDMQPRPALATEWSQTPDGKVWTFTLRQGVTWQDGTPFTARDVAFTFNYIVKNDMSNYTSYTGSIEKAEALDDYTVRITCAKPKANMLAMPVTIVPEHIWSKITPKAASTTFPNKPPIIGTGPFQTVEWKKGQYLTLEANPNYWAGRPKVDEIIFQYYTNPDSMTADLKSGRLDVASDIPPGQFDGLASTPGLTAIGGAVNGFTDLGFNCYDDPDSLGSPALKDPAFRRALNYALDKAKIVEVGYFGRATPGTSLMRSDYYSPELDWHWQPPADVEYTFDLERAKAELEAAGYRDADGDGVREVQGEPIVLRLYARTQSVPDQRVGRLIAGWFEEVGLRVKYSVIDEATLIDRVYSTNSSGAYAPDFDAFIWYWGPDPDPNFQLSILTTDQLEGWSDTWWSNAEYDALFREQEATVDPKARQQLVWQMQEIAYEESPYIVLTYPQQLQAYDVKDWTGWVRWPAETGGVMLNQFNVDSYLSVQPQAAAETTAESSNTAWIVAVLVAAVAAAAVAALIVRRRRRRVEEV